MANEHRTKKVFAITIWFKNNSSNTIYTKEMTMEEHEELINNLGVETHIKFDTQRSLKVYGGDEKTREVVYINLSEVVYMAINPIATRE